MAEIGIRKVASKTLWRGRRVRLTLDTFRTDLGKEFHRETIRHPASVVIAPIVGRGKILLIRQFRHALDRYIYEIPAGTSEPRETLLTCARRELAEETGYQAKQWKRLLEFYPAPGVSTERMVLYRAQGLTPLVKKVAMDKDEHIIPRAVTFSQAIRMVRKNQVVDAKSIIGILIGLGRIKW